MAVYTSVKMQLAQFTHRYSKLRGAFLLEVVRAAGIMPLPAVVHATARVFLPVLEPYRVPHHVLLATQRAPQKYTYTYTLPSRSTQISPCRWT